jgi:hypothetical protein
MSTEAPSKEPVEAMPLEVSERLDYWHGLWRRSAQYHYVFGVVSVAASVISTSLEGGQAKVFSIVAAIATAMIGFMHPERRYMKFVRAWRVLDVAAMRYRHGLIGKAALIDAVERGEAAIAEFEDKNEGSAAEDKKPGPASDAPQPEAAMPAPSQSAVAPTEAGAPKAASSTEP